MARKTKRQAQETRQQIIDAALRLFTVQGVLPHHFQILQPRPE